MAKVEVNKDLLMDWWCCYANTIYTLAELKEFEKIIDEYGVDKVMDAALASYVCGDGSPTVMLVSIRRGTVKKLFDSLPDVSKMDEKQKAVYEFIKSRFALQMVLGS